MFPGLDEAAHPVERIPNLDEPGVGGGRPEPKPVRLTVIAYDLGVLRKSPADPPGVRVPECNVRASPGRVLGRGHPEPQRD